MAMLTITNICQATDSNGKHYELVANLTACEHRPIHFKIIIRTIQT